MTTQHFHGGQFQGCSFGDSNSLNNYFAAVEKAEKIENDIKDKLKEARKAIDELPLSDADKDDVVQQLVAGKGFESAEQGEARLKGFEKPVRLHEVRWHD